MEQENQYSESAVEELTQPEVFDESDIDRIIANLNDWD